MNDREPRDDQLALFGGGDPPERRGQLARDAAARRTAQTELERPLLVEAGAGTGKTTTLTARILAWCLGPGWEAAGERVAAREAAARPLAAPAPPDEDAVAADVLSRVVAITFTEAAAAEMASRVGTALAALTGHQEPPPWILPEALPADPPERSRRARALLGALDHLVVRTIHAFCRSLLAAHPLEAGLHPELRVDPDGLEVEAIVREVVEDRLREAYGGIGPDGPDGAAEPAAGDPDLLALAGAGIGPAELAEALVSALVHENLRPEDLESSPFAPGRVRELREGLQEAVRRFEEAAGGRLDGLSRSKKTGEALEALRVTASRADEPADGGDGFEAFCRLCSELAETWGGRLRDRLKDWSRGAFNKTEADALAGGAGPEPVVRAAGALLARLDALRRLRPELLERSRRALAPMLAAARREMRVRGLATFHDLLTEARDLLTRRPDVAGSVRRRIDQLLVDELQDTDRLQVEVITAIGLPDPAGPDAPDAGRPGLFLVGDPKQSIYGWRNADLRAYAALRERVRAAGGETVTLAENFRSVPAILDEVGRAVEPVMIEESGVQPRFEPLVACERLAEEPGFARGRWAPVEYWVSWLPEAEGDGARPGLAATRSGDATLLEAEAIARDLAHLHREEGVPWHHAALLLRSFSDLDDYLEALRREGVPFAVTGDRQYYRRREVIDAAALVRSVIDPGDHLALLTVLRSPAVGVPDAALIPLWREGFPRAMTDLVGPDPESLEALRDAVARAAERMPTASSGKGSVPGLDRVAGWDRALLAAVDALARLRESFARDPADRFVERLRSLVPLELMASARHLGSYRLANLDRFFRRLTEAMESSAGDVTAILRALRRGVSEALEEEEGRPAGAGETEDAVQVMTIHKAKGLDFGHVYLAQLHKGSPPDRLPWVAAGEVREEEGASRGPARVEYCLFGAPTPGFAAVEEERRRVEAAERVRTLYVAMTRAEERLVLAGRWPETPRPRKPEEADSYLDLLSGRFPSELDLAEVWADLVGSEGSPTDRTDRHRMRWVFPGLAPREREREAGAAEERETGAPALPAPADVKKDSERLRKLRTKAAERQERPLGGRASPTDRRPREMDEEPSRPSRDAASDRSSVGRRRSQAVGTAIHRLLEDLDLTGNPTRTDLVDRLQDARTRIPSLVASDLPPAEQEDARREAHREAEEVLDRIVGSRGEDLLDRLALIADNVVARELPILAPPDASGEEPGEKPVAFVSGSIDLVYRDPEKAELVVADYKANRVDDSGDVEAWIRDQRAHYTPQLRTYGRAIQQAFGLPSCPRTELWFLWLGRIVEVPGSD